MYFIANIPTHASIGTDSCAHKSKSVRFCAHTVLASIVQVSNKYTRIYPSMYTQHIGIHMYTRSDNINNNPGNTDTHISSGSIESVCDIPPARLKRAS